MTTARLSKQNQMVLPKQAREHMGVGPGDEFLVICRRNGSILLIKPDQMLDALKGSGKDTYGDTDEYLRRERASWD